VSASPLCSLPKVRSPPVLHPPAHARPHPCIALGAKVIAAASPAKLEVTKTHGGADHAVDYTRPGWQKDVLKITGGKGVNVVYDPVGMIKGAFRV
jgi:hypothetical protein